MAKKPKSLEHHEYVRAIRDAEGNLRWEYKLIGGTESGMSHDEDVTDFSNQDIERLTRGILSIEKDDPVKIEVCDE